MKDARIQRYTPHWYYTWFKWFFPGLSAHEYVDRTLLLWDQLARLDIIKFDDALHRIHGQYEDRGLSMKDLITQEYGAQAAHWVEIAIGAHIQPTEGNQPCT